MSTSGMRVAVIGGGVTGLVSAYILAKEGAEVVVYEKDDAVGGRAKTATLPDNTSLDLGFMVFTPGMYPQEVMELLECLKVEVELADVSLSVSLNEGKGPEWGTQKGLSSLFAQKKNLLNPWFWKMFKEISSLKHDASTYVEELERNPDVDRNETLGHFVQSRGYSDFFQKTFLIPTCGSIWSCTWDVMNFSAYTVLSFLCNNNVLEVPSVIPGGLAQSWSSQSFVNRIKAELESRGCQLKTNSQVHSVWANHEDCGVTCEDGSREAYDGCVIATNAPDAVKILGKEATFDELRILGAFQYANSGFFLHQDKGFMPKNPTLWGSRNFIESASDGAYITYWLNNIQNINKTGEPFLLTVNPPSKPKDTLLKWSTSLPVPSVSASKALSQLSLIQGKRRIWFAGSYQGYGFPEDGIKAGIIAAHGLLRKSYTSHNNPKHMLPTSLESGARLLVTKFLERFITAGCIILLEEGGTALTFEGNTKSCALKVAIRVHTPQFYWKVAMEADLGFAEAYMNGDISFVDKDEGLLNFFLIVMTNTELNSHASKLKRGWWTPMLFTSILSSAKYFLKYVSSKNSLSRSRRNIAEHYDLSNELFSLYLDETMTYSCAVFKNTSEDLKSAQLRKVHMLIDKAKVKKEHHVLDIGFGWGSLAFELVKKTGCKYTGITLAEKQFEHVQSKVKEAGLENQMELILCDYRQLPKNHKYDRVISCGMIEHVGHEYMKEYFECCESLLAQNGILVLQFVAMADEKYDEQRHTSGFIKEYVFPGGCVPSLNQVVSSMAAGSRFSVVHLEEIGVHYFHTLRRWRQNFLQNKSQVLELDGFDEKFIRTWEYYFDYMGAGFKYCLLGDYQVVFNRPGDVAAFGGDPYNDVPVA